MLTPGETIGDWTVEAFLGEGSMGRVYSGTQEGERVAIKVMHSSRPLVPGHLDPEWRRFDTRLRALSRLHHPAVLHIDSWGRDEARACLWLVMELLEGEDLHQLTAQAPMTSAQVRVVFAQLADGLGASHHAGLLHGDIKPANLFLRADGTAVMMDFCLPVHRTQDGDFADQVPLGTPRYLPPEAFQSGPRLGSVAADVYSLGQAMHEAVSGRAAFVSEGRGPDRLLCLLRDKGIARSLDPGPKAGRVVRRAVRWATHPDPAKRPTARQLSELLTGDRSLARLPSRWLHMLDSWRRAG